MKSIKRVLTVCLAAAALTVGASSASQARTNVAWSGKVLVPSQASCLDEWYGSVKNTCGNYVDYLIPVSVNAPGNKTIQITGTGISTICRPTGINREITSFWGGAAYSFPSNNNVNTLSMTGAYVPGYGAAYVYCNLATSSRINALSWND